MEINEMIQGLPRKGAPPQLPRMRRGLPEKRPIRNVQKIVAVSSAKGGVGKSTLAGTVISRFSMNSRSQPL
jgi:ATP-binding protein involved in chromosome partitioning